MEAWGLWAQATVTRAVTVTKLVTASKRRLGKALGEEVWAGATANKPRQGLGAKGVDMDSKGVAAMADKQVAEVLGVLATDPTDATTSGQPLLHSGHIWYPANHVRTHSVTCSLRWLFY